VAFPDRGLEGGHVAQRSVRLNGTSRGVWAFPWRSQENGIEAGHDRFWGVTGRNSTTRSVVTPLKPPHVERGHESDNRTGPRALGGLKGSPAGFLAGPERSGAGRHPTAKPERPMSSKYIVPAPPIPNAPVPLIPPRRGGGGASGETKQHKPPPHGCCCCCFCCSGAQLPKG
jgi:hypothetical protein